MYKKKIINNRWRYKFNKIAMRLRLIPEQNWDKINKYFIISTGRTGTHFLSKFLNTNKSIFAIHEPHPTFLRLAVNYAEGEINDDQVLKKIEICRRALYKEVQRENRDIYVESSNRLFSLVPHLRKNFPGAKFIHVIRDGRDFVRSGMSRNWYKESDTGTRLRASNLKNDPYKNKWNKMNRFEKITWLWQKKDRYIYDELRKEDSITIKFENLFKNEDYLGIKKLIKYMDLPKQDALKSFQDLIDQKMDSTKNYEIPKWPDWDDKTLKQFDQIAGKHMEKFYDNYKTR